MHTNPKLYTNFPPSVILFIFFDAFKKFTKMGFIKVINLFLSSSYDIYAFLPP
jgi:hypothetical protein